MERMRRRVLVLCFVLGSAACNASEASSPSGLDAAGRASSSAPTVLLAGQPGASMQTDAGAARAPAAAPDASPPATVARLDAAVTTAPDADDGDGASGCADATLCADFEDLAPGALAGAWSTVAPDCSGDGVVRVDDAVAHSGAHAIRVDSSGGYCNHVFATPALDADMLGAPLWVRMYVRFAQAFGASHTTFVALHDERSGADLRMGGQSEILMWNRELDDATLPELSPTGIGTSVSPLADTWLCIEVHLDGAAGVLQTYVDGALVPGLVVDDVATADVDGQWLRPGPWSAEVSDLRLGWESYGDQSMTLWFDDVVVASQRPGC